MKKIDKTARQKARELKPTFGNQVVGLIQALFGYDNKLKLFTAHLPANVDIDLKLKNNQSWMKIIYSLVSYHFWRSYEAY